MIYESTNSFICERWDMILRHKYYVQLVKSKSTQQLNWTQWMPCQWLPKYFTIDSSFVRSLWFHILLFYCYLWHATDSNMSSFPLFATAFNKKAKNIPFCVENNIKELTLHDYIQEPTKCVSLIHTCLTGPLHLYILY